MIQEADGGCLFRAPKNILEQYPPHLQIAETYDEFLKIIKEFLGK